MRPTQPRSPHSAPPHFLTCTIALSRRSLHCSACAIPSTRPACHGFRFQRQQWRAACASAGCCCCGLRCGECSGAGVEGRPRAGVRARRGAGLRALGGAQRQPQQRTHRSEASSGPPLSPAAPHPSAALCCCVRVVPCRCRWRTAGAEGWRRASGCGTSSSTQPSTGSSQPVRHHTHPPATHQLLLSSVTPSPSPPLLLYPLPLLQRLSCTGTR